MVNKRKNKFLFRVGVLSASIGVTMLLFVLYCYSFRQDWCAAVCFFPVWIWGLAGIVLGLFTLLYSMRISVIILISWFVFIAVFAEEPRSMVRGLFASGRLKDVPVEKLLTVVSLNCGGGNIKAVEEIGVYKPDILLLQELPAYTKKLELCVQKIFGNNATITFDSDNAIITGEEIEKVALMRPQNRFMTQARVRLKSGFEIEVICLRLKPPCIEINLLSGECWKLHREDRKSRGKQIAAIAERVDLIPDEVAVIVGGDFNVGANDGCLKLLNRQLSDTFNKGGVGWGHTAANSVPLFRVDQIWVSSHFDPIAVSAKKTQHSDHRMVISHIFIR